jgi:hypothetical protein
VTAAATAAAAAAEAEAQPLPVGLGSRTPLRRCERRRSWIPLYRCGRARPSCQLRCLPASASSCRGCAPLFQSATQPTQPPVSVSQAGARPCWQSVARGPRRARAGSDCLAAVRGRLRQRQGSDAQSGTAGARSGETRLEAPKDAAASVSSGTILASVCRKARCARRRRSVGAARARGGFPRALNSSIFGR